MDCFDFVVCLFACLSVCLFAQQTTSTTTGNQTLTITDLENLKTPFSHLARYHVSRGTTTDSVDLFYHGILGEDSGILTCQKLSSSSPSSATLNLKVLVPLTSLRIFFVHFNSTDILIEQRPLESGSVIELTENKFQGIRFEYYRL
ncbi:hypothetical protein HELRODRAFT_176348 [Helobdella robusta]|uniref:Uncharacterized protein n=1 Tax=Helobdella robusta TaxID=6412 RepID=T1FAE9_HELRO|nr:hypothetical protein HELRODRAFT_176348 [Helobdella robusta]ESO00040.1 hypothetical protein HELRODRAFT_176348 [Helobdella robusta]